MDEKLNNIPEENTEEKEILEPAEETAGEEAPEIAGEETSETAEPEIDPAEDSVPVYVTEESAPGRPAGLLRSAITAVIVLALFAAVYFIYTAFNPEPEKPQAQPAKPKTEMTISEGGEKSDENQKNENASAGETTAPKQQEENKKDMPTGVEILGETATSPEYKDATAEITAKANAKYGEEIMVLPEYNEEMRTVKINGETRRCYLAAVVKIDLSAENGNVIIHAAIDAGTGDVWFDDTDKWEVID